METAHLERQQNINLNLAQENFCLEGGVDKAVTPVSSYLQKYLNPSEVELSQNTDDKEPDDGVYERAWSVGQTIGEYEAQHRFWDSLEIVAPQLDVIYNYQSIMYGTLVLPKRLQVSKGGVKREDNLLTVKGLSLHVYGDFRALDRAPTWRDFFPERELSLGRLRLNEIKVSASQKDIWVDGVMEGYADGVCLEYLNYKQALSNLSADFSERFLYVVAERRGLTQSPNIKAVTIPILESHAGDIELNSTRYQVEDFGDFKDLNEWGRVQ